MGINRIIEIFEVEKQCIKRNIGKDCNRDCSNCDLVLEDEELLTAYNLAISILKTIQVIEK